MNAKHASVTHRMRTTGSIAEQGLCVQNADNDRNEHESRSEQATDEISKGSGQYEKLDRATRTNKEKMPEGITKGQHRWIEGRHERRLRTTSRGTSWTQNPQVVHNQRPSGKSHEKADRRNAHPKKACRVRQQQCRAPKDRLARESAGGQHLNARSGHGPKDGKHEPIGEKPDGKERTTEMVKYRATDRRTRRKPTTQPEKANTK